MTPEQTAIVTAARTETFLELRRAQHAAEAAYEADPTTENDEAILQAMLACDAHAMVFALPTAVYNAELAGFGGIL